MKKATRDVEKTYSRSDFIKKIRRFADALETGRKFSIQIKGERIPVPKEAIINIAHEKSKVEEEVEFQIKWKK